MCVIVVTDGEKKNQAEELPEQIMAKIFFKISEGRQTTD